MKQILILIILLSYSAFGQLNLLFDGPSIPSSGGGGADQSRVFYFATNGSSSNPGTEASPYDMAKLNSTTWLPGDSLCLMYGNQRTRQTITFTESGTAGNPITLCAKLS